MRTSASSASPAMAPSSPPIFSGYEKLVVALLALTQFTVVLDFMVMSPLGDLLMKSLQLTPRQFGFAVSAYALSAGASGLLTAGFADRFDRKRLLVIFYAGFIVGTLFCGLAHTYALLVAARIFTGLFGGVIGALSLAIITDLFSLAQRGRVLGFVQMGFGASQVLGIPIGLYVAGIWGWESPFLFIAGLAAVVCLMIVMQLRPVNAHLANQVHTSFTEHIGHILAQPDYRLGFMATAFLSIGGFMMMPFGSAFAINNLHVSQQQLPIMFMVAGVTTLVIMPFVGRLADKMNKFYLFAGASVWMMVVVLAYTQLGQTPFWVVLLFNVAMMMGIMSRMVPSMALNSAIPAPADRGAFMAVNASLQQFAGGIAAAIAGAIVYQQTQTSPLEHYDILGYIIALVTAITIYLVYRVSQLTERLQPNRDLTLEQRNKVAMVAEA